MSPRRGLYVALDVNFYDNPKVIEAGERADRLYTQALTLVKRTWSDGFISDAQIKRFGLTRVQQRCNQLAAVGLFERDNEAGGWWIHDWFDNGNRSKAEQDEIVQKRSSAGSKGGRPPKQTAKQVGIEDGKQVVKQSKNLELSCTEVNCPDSEVTPPSTVTPRGDPDSLRFIPADWDDMSIPLGAPRQTGRGER